MINYPIEDYKLNTQGAASLLGRHVQYVRILARTGKLPCIRNGGQWMFCKQELLDNLRNDTEQTIERQDTNEQRPSTESDLFQ